MADTIALAQALIRCPSVTPTTAGVFDVLEAALAPLGFTTHRVTFEEAGTEPVDNLYACLGDAGPNLCFAGHTDVVPVGDEAGWTYPPFAAEIHDGYLYGRGAEDMKGAIAAFVTAVARYGKPQHGRISLLITQDEEGIAINGTRKMLDWLKERGESVDACIVGEPTNVETLGDTIKIGRRGSMYLDLTVHGKQGHVAYPERADNPITRLTHILYALKAEPMDAGTPHFPPSNLEITSVDVANPTRNLIPARASALCNVRFNVTHTGEGIAAWAKTICERYAPGGYTLTHRISGDAFLTEEGMLTGIVAEAVKEVTGQIPAFSTGGGTSDARFIKDICPVVEFGTTGFTPHQVNERVETKVLQDLSACYEAMLRRFFAA